MKRDLYRTGFAIVLAIHSFDLYYKPENGYPHKVRLENSKKDRLDPQCSTPEIKELKVTTQ